MMDMITDFITQKDVYTHLFRILITSLGTIGVVYISGRLLGLTKTDKSKNTLAAIMLYIISAGIQYVYFWERDIILNLWLIFIYGTISAVPYILFFWRMFDRVDTLLDKKGLRDKKKYRG